MSVCVSYTALLLRNISQLSDPNKTEYPTALYIYSLLSVKMFKDQKKIMHAHIPNSDSTQNLIGQVGFFSFIFYLMIINKPHLKTDVLNFHCWSKLEYHNLGIFKLYNFVNILLCLSNDVKYKTT